MMSEAAHAAAIRDDAELARELETLREQLRVANVLRVQLSTDSQNHLDRALAAELERDAAIKYLAKHLAERSILHDAKAAEFDPEATAFAAGMRRAAEVCQNGGADWAYDLIITDLERLEE